MRANRCALLLATLIAAPFAHSERAQPTVGDLSRVQSETLLYKAQGARAQALADKRRSESEAGIDTTGATGQAAPPVIDSELPTITGISGRAGRLFATFRYPNGNTATAKSGEAIPGNFRVAEVSLDRAVITRGDRRIPLQFGDAPTQQPQQSSGQLLPGQFPGPYPAPGVIRP